MKILDLSSMQECHIPIPSMVIVQVLYTLESIISTLRPSLSLLRKEFL